MKQKTRARRCAALLLALMLALASCGGEGTASTMRLMRTEGEVGVSDGDGKSVTPKENLMLYSGYGVGTRPASFAWINLDDVKLAKLDEKSEIAIQKEGKQLEVEIKSGSFFFNVTQPLEADETMNIRTSTMVIGVRGTCGWVEVPDASHMNIYLLEGKVECTAGETVTVMAGEVGRLDETTGTVTVEPFGQDAIPGFVRGEIEDIPLDDIPETVEPSLAPNPAEDALAQYRAIVGQAASYDYGADDPTGTYRYALAQMQTDYDVPALLLEQDTTFGISNVLVFQYEPEGGQVIACNGTMSEGVAQAGGYRGGLTAAADGNGILSTEFSSGSGMGSTSRVTLNGNSLQSTLLWEGNIFEDVNSAEEEIGSLELDWHDIADLSGLDSWTPGGFQPTPPGPATQQPGEPQLPTDGNRIVFTGTIDTYSYDELITLQGEPDPNAPYSDTTATYRLIIPDTPQNMTLRSGDGLSSYENEVRMIDVTYAGDLSQYDGQHLTFSIDPANTWWPSDTSLPLGQPHTDDVHVLQ